MASRPIPDSPEAESVRISPSGVWEGDIQFREVTKAPSCVFLAACCPLGPSLVFSFLRGSR